MGPGRDASARRHRAAERPLRRRHRAASAERRLPRDHPQGHGPARPAQEAVRRPRPVRRRRARHQADAARQRASPSRKKSPAAWCRATTFPRSRKASSTRSSTARSAFRWSISRVALVDGSYHTVDSSDMAFRTAGRIGIVEGLPQCQPVLLEPIHLVEIVCPNEATAKINALMSGRRGQILGFDTREGWEGWDVVRAKMPEAEDRRSHRRNPLGDRRRRHLHLQVRPHGRADRPHRRSDRRGAPRGGMMRAELRVLRQRASAEAVLSRNVSTPIARKIS